MSKEWSEAVEPLNKQLEKMNAKYRAKYAPMNDAVNTAQQALRNAEFAIANAKWVGIIPSEEQFHDWKVDSDQGRAMQVSMFSAEPIHVLSKTPGVAVRGLGDRRDKLYAAFDHKTAELVGFMHVDLPDYPGDETYAKGQVYGERFITAQRPLAYFFALLNRERFVCADVKDHYVGNSYGKKHSYLPESVAKGAFADHERRYGHEKGEMCGRVGKAEKVQGEE